MMKCDVCGYRIRSEDHEQGTHHKDVVDRKKIKKDDKQRAYKA